MTKQIHKKSNHPENITKQIPLSIEKRVSDLSSNKEIFDEAAKYYEQALQNCGYDQKLNYIYHRNKTVKNEDPTKGI